MKIKSIEPERFEDYKVPSMLIAFPSCTFKCEAECGAFCCQNSGLALAPTINISADKVIQEYLSNPITSAIVLGGLEPLDSFQDVLELIDKLRNGYHCDDTIVIYTGYNKTEISYQIEGLKMYKNIIIKFGRYIPNEQKCYDELLGVWLASPNQMAEKIS